MENPHKQLREYFENIMFDFLYINALYEQVKTIYKWNEAKEEKTLDTGSFFFRLILFSFIRTILIDTYKLVSPKEDKSLVDWLNQVKVHTEAFKPVQYSLRHNKTQIISKKEYPEIVDRHIEQIISKQPIIDRIKGRRNTFLAHRDSEIFNNSQLLEELYPINDSEIEELLETISDIFKEQHLYVCDSAFDVRINSGTDIETVLRFIRAATRFREDERLTKELKVNVYEYFLPHFKRDKIQHK